jgi:hypothetical protein
MLREPVPQEKKVRLRKPLSEERKTNQRTGEAACEKIYDVS